MSNCGIGHRRMIGLGGIKNLHQKQEKKRFTSLLSPTPDADLKKDEKNTREYPRSPESDAKLSELP